MRLLTHLWPLATKRCRPTVVKCWFWLYVRVMRSPIMSLTKRVNEPSMSGLKIKSVPTNKLIISPDAPVAALVQSPAVRLLIQYLRRNDDITADKLAKLTNISTYRANKQLKLLTEQGLLLVLNKQRTARYALKLAE